MQNVLGRSIVALLACGAFAIVVACASGGMPIGNSDDDAPIDGPGVDAQKVTSDGSITPAIDAPVPPDAFVFLDAPPPPPDAASPFCTANNQCPVAGECCIRFGLPQGFCGEGIPIGDECLPQ